MKYLLTACILFITTGAAAQIVNIPDPAFKQELLYYPGLDINNNGEIEVSEALTITNLQILGVPPYITDLTGLEAFQNIERFSLSWYAINNLDLSNLLPNVKSLAIDGNPSATSLNISGCTKLENFACSYLGTNFTGPPYFNLIIGHLPRLKAVGFDGVNFGTLDFTGCDSLKRINTALFLGPQYYAQSIDISGLTQIDTFYNFTVNGALLARNCTGLKSLKSFSPLDFNGPLDVTGCTNLKDVTLDYLGNGLTTLDFSTCTSLDNISFVATKNLQYLNIKNGLAQTVTIGNPYNNPPVNVCADDVEVTPVLNAFLSPLNGNPFTVSVSTNCSFFPGGNYNTIKGKVKLDLNNNGCDNSDPAAFDIPIRVNDNSGGITTVYSMGGNFAYYSYAGIFNVAPYFPYLYFTVNPAATTVTFTTANSIIDTADFCISPVGTHNDLEITFLPLSAARPGFTGRYRLVYKNNGNTTLSGNVQLNFDNSKMNFVEATIIPVQIPGQLGWTYSSLQPFESRSIDLSFNMLPPPVNNIGDTLIFLAMVNPVANDETPYDNSFILPQRIIGSYDPNNKECLEGSKLAITAIDNYLHYLIRFQNMGNDTAFNIVIADTLSDKLDRNTVEFVSSSHPCHVTQENGKLEFFFEDIKLPYKAINEAGSNGFAAFKIKPRSNLVLGDSLNNKAAIYFDFNPPVITNTAVSVVSPQRLLPVVLEYFSATSNSNENLLTWKVRASNGFTNFTIERSDDNIHYTELGNITATVERCQLPFDFTDDQPMPGKNYYRLRITGADVNSFYSDVKLIERTASGFQVTAIINDQNNTTVYLNAPKQQTVQIKIVAADGQMMYSQPKAIPAGRSQVNLALKNLPKGIYILIVYTNDGEMISRRFLK